MVSAEAKIDFVHDRQSSTHGVQTAIANRQPTANSLILFVWEIVFDSIVHFHCLFNEQRTETVCYGRTQSHLLGMELSLVATRTARR